MIVLLIFTAPLIGLLIECAYFHYLNNFFTFSFYTNAKDLATALLSYSIAMFGIVAMIVTLVYGLSKPGVNNYRRKFGVAFACLWVSCLIYLSLAGFLSILGFAKTEAIHLTILLKFFVGLFIASFLQSVLTIFVGINVLVNSNKVA
ncbi:hypothetical protein ABTB00_17720 [Acinetobacter baumannii]|nr:MULTISPECIES: hypothetical protein [Acinetobacter calcoaceticus/baumannii complex]MCZ3286925.1 hypothetical protein [Acinetobacter baumannii]